MCYPMFSISPYPVVDVMDAGIRDNYGQETMIRFLDVFNEWLKENTAGVVMIQIRDRKGSEWEENIRSGRCIRIVYKTAYSNSA